MTIHRVFFAAGRTVDQSVVIRAVHGNGTVFPVIGQRRAAYKAIVAFGAGEAVLLHKEPRIFTQDRRRLFKIRIIEIQHKNSLL